MEQGQCWMKTKRKYSVSSNPSYDDSSWEEQAFAEDAAGNSLGGCIWPPRSYSCSFCKREFRSAQALGGHMNVHRRDRARLKQPSSPKSEILCHHDLESHLHKPLQNNPFTSLGYLNPSSVYGLAYKTNPNSDPDVLASPSSPSPPNKALEETTLIPLYNSSILHKTSPLQSSTSWSTNLDGDHRLYSCKFHPEANIEKPSKGFRGKWDSDGTDDVGVSLNLVLVETKEAGISCKKMKTEASSIPLFTKSSFEFSPSSIEEVDLELRLGNNRSKV